MADAPRSDVDEAEATRAYAAGYSAGLGAPRSDDALRALIALTFVHHHDMEHVGAWENCPRSNCAATRAALATSAPPSADVIRLSADGETVDESSWTDPKG